MFYQIALLVMVAVLVQESSCTQNSSIDKMGIGVNETKWDLRNETNYTEIITPNNDTVKINDEEQENENENRRRKRAEEEKFMHYRGQPSVTSHYWDEKLNRAFGIVGFLALLLVIISSVFYCRIRKRVNKKYYQNQQSMTTCRCNPEIQSISNSVNISGNSEEQDQRVNYNPSDSVLQTPGLTENIITALPSASAPLPTAYDHCIVITAEVNPTAPSPSMQDHEQDRNVTTVDTVLADVRC